MAKSTPIRRFKGKRNGPAPGVLNCQPFSMPCPGLSHGNFMAKRQLNRRQNWRIEKKSRASAPLAPPNASSMRYRNWKAATWGQSNWAW